MYLLQTTKPTAKAAVALKATNLSKCGNRQTTQALRNSMPTKEPHTTVRIKLQSQRMLRQN